MTDIDALIERLREASVNDPIVDEAADALAKLQRNAEKRACAHSCEVNALKAEIAKLREALERFLAEYIEMVNSGDCGFWNPENEDKVQQARAALGEKI